MIAAARRKQGFESDTKLGSKHEDVVSDWPDSVIYENHRVVAILRPDVSGRLKVILTGGEEG